MKRNLRFYIWNYVLPSDWTLKIGLSTYNWKLMPEQVWTFWPVCLAKKNVHNYSTALMKEVYFRELIISKSKFSFICTVMLLNPKSQDGLRSQFQLYYLWKVILNPFTDFRFNELLIRGAGFFLRPIFCKFASHLQFEYWWSYTKYQIKMIHTEKL